MRALPLIILAWFFAFRGGDLQWHSVGPFNMQIDCEGARQAMAATRETSLSCRER